MIKTVPPFFLSSLRGSKVRSLVTMASLFAVCATSAHHASLSGKKVPDQKKTNATSPHRQAAAAADDLAVTAVAPEYRTFNRMWSLSNKIMVTVRNNGTAARTNIDIQLDVAGANAETLTQTIASLDAGASTTVAFTGSVANAGSQVMEARVPDDPGDADPANNTLQATQEVSCSRLGFTGTEPTTHGFGFGAGTGIVSARYQAPSIPVYVKGVTVHLSDDVNSIGKSIMGVLLDETGNIIADAEPFYIGAGDLNNEVELNFYTPAQLSAGSVFFAGVKLIDGDQAPVGVADPATAEPNRYYTFGDEGGSATHHTADGSFKIGAMVAVAAELSKSVPDGEIVAGTPVTFTATEGFAAYTFMVNGVAVESGPSNTYTYYPSNNDNVYVEIGSNGCVSDPIGNYVMNVKGINPSGNILYVNKHNSNPGDGSTWATAVTELADALRYAKLHEAEWTPENPLQIWVAGGTYKPLYAAADDKFGTDDGTYNAFLLVKNVQLYGGFAGTETTLAARNLSLAANKSILTGDFNNDDVITGSGPDLSITNVSDNACHIIIAAGDVGSASMDGFTIRGGGGDGESLQDIVVNGETITWLGGAGVHNYASSPRYTNLVIYGNRSVFYGGGVYNDHASPIFTNVLIYHNMTDFQGGGMANTNLSEPVLTNLTITGNLAGVDGGGYANISSNPLIRNSIVSGNSSAVYDDNSYPVVTYSLIEGVAEDADNGNLDGSLDPGFLNPAAGIYTLRPGSIAINAGSYFYYMMWKTPDISSVTTDLAGKPRIGGSTVDLGVYETTIKDQVITAEDMTLTYGDGDTTLNVAASSGLPLTLSMDVDDVADLYQDPLDNTKWRLKPKKAGAVVITANQPGDEDFDAAAPVEILVLVNRKELTVTADNKTTSFGEDLPALTLSYDGFVLNEDATAITPPIAKTTATKASIPGQYPINLSGGSAENYNIHFVHGILTVEGARINIQQQPVAQITCAGATAGFSADASTYIDVPVGYQWQQSADSSSWTDIKGATNAQLTTSAEQDAYYRCALTAPGRVVYTDAVKLTLKPVEKPVIELPNILCLSEGRYTLNASIPGGVFSGPGVHGNTWIIDTLKPGVQTIQYSYVSNNGCSVTVSKTANLSLCGEKTLVGAVKANPNPTNGPLTVKLLLTDNAKQNLMVSNSTGQVVMQKTVQLKKGWNQVPLDLSHLSAGLYFITINGYGQINPAVITIMKQ